MVEIVHVLREDRDLRERVPEAERERAEAASAARVLRLPTGRWPAGRHAHLARGGAGLMIVQGVLIRRVGVRRHYGAELLSIGDIVRPWQHDGEDTGILPFELAWRVISATRMAILDARWLARMAPWPSVSGELIGRALERSLRLGTLLSVAQQRRLDTRLLLVLWKLAERFGTVRPTGVHIDLPLTHDMLAHVAAAQRPSVSLALSRLTAEGHLRREGRLWVLLGDPPEWEDEDRVPATASSG
jgi:CRP/FNR family cyclic AMP-dependent transcriptional regulator